MAASTRSTISRAHRFMFGAVSPWYVRPIFTLTPLATFYGEGVATPISKKLRAMHLSCSSD